MRFLVRNFLNIWRHSNDFHNVISRKIPFGTRLNDTNYLSSTYFTGHYMQVAIASFFYGALVYLSQRIQVWCLVISFTQLYFFKTGKSFWPLIIFTIVIALQEMYVELKKWSNDKLINSHMVTLANGESIPRGQIRPGDVIQLENGQECPCDLIFIGYTSRKNNNRVTVYMNEAQVTGENAPVRKFCPVSKGEVIQAIHIDDLRFHKARISLKDARSTLEVTDRAILYGNSTLECEDGVTLQGIASWISNETKALSRTRLDDDYRQPSPFSEYTMKGFLVTVILMVSISTINTIVAIMKSSQPNINYITVWITQLLYLNMMVPQAIQQTKMAVTAVFSHHFPNGVFVNNSTISDILGYVTRIVTDKTGTLTCNKMEPILTMIFEKDKYRINKASNMLLDVDIMTLLPIFGTTGNQHEEIAIRNNFSNVAQLIFFDPPEPNEKIPGEIHFLHRGSLCKITVLIQFGVMFNYLSKASLFEYQGDYYVAVQGGGDEFWQSDYWKQKDVDMNLSPNNSIKFGQWGLESKSFDPLNGSPRIWSHGIRKLNSKDAQNLISRWHNALDQDAPLKELEIIYLDAIRSDLEWTSQTLMVDTYRQGVLEGIETLYKHGKQVSICTGDSESAAVVISKQLQFPSTHVIMKSTIPELMQQVTSLRDQNVSMTLFFGGNTMKMLELHEVSVTFQDALFQNLFRLFDEKVDGSTFKHYPVFYRATPSLKPFVVRMMQYKIWDSTYDWFFLKRNYVLAIGDGSNDLNMFQQADVSLGIESGETKDVVSKASFYLVHEWKPTVELLIKEGPEKSAMISLMVKLVFLKHWMTAFTLLFDLIFAGFPLMPLDPINPMLMMIWNAIIFTIIVSHSAVDAASKEVYNKKDLMSIRSFVRWVLSAACTGLSLDWTIRWLFPFATSSEFGAMLLVGKAVSIVLYLYMITNQQSHILKKHSEIQGQMAPFLFLLSSSCVGIVTILQHTSWFTSKMVQVGMVGILMVPIWFSMDRIFKVVTMRMILETWDDIKLNLDVFVPRSLHWFHTVPGRFIPIMVLILLIRLWSGVSLLILFLIALLTILFSSVIFVVGISKIGFLRALLEGKVIAVAFISFLFGYLFAKLQ